MVERLCRPGKGGSETARARRAAAATAPMAQQQRQQQPYPPRRAPTHPTMPMRQAFQATGSCIRMHTHPNNGRTYGFLSIDGSDEQIYVAESDAPPQLQNGERVLFTVEPHFRNNTWEGKYRAIHVQRLQPSHDPHQMSARPRRDPVRVAPPPRRAATPRPP